MTANHPIYFVDSCLTVAEIELATRPGGVVRRFDAPLSVDVIPGREFQRMMRVEESKFPLGWDERDAKI